MVDADPLTATSAPWWLGQLVEQANDATAAFDADGRIVYVNDAALEILGYDTDELTATGALDLVHPDDLGRAAANVGGVRDGARPLPGLVRLRRADGRHALFEVTVSAVDLPVPPAGPGPLTLVVMRDHALQDAHWQFLAALAAGEPFHECVEQLARRLTTRADGVLAVAYDDEKGIRRVAGDLPPQLAGATTDGRLDRTPGTPWAAALASGTAQWGAVDDLPEPFRSLARDRGATACVTVPVPDPASADPALLVQWPTQTAMTDLLIEALVRRPRQAVLLALERQHSQRRLEHLALHDGLTGLVNRERFFEVLGGFADAGAPYGLCYVDLDRFKPVNDTLGHLAGDEVIVMCARRLESCARSGDLIGRLGGDEFGVFCPDASGPHIEHVAARIVRSLGEPFAVAGSVVEIGASVGVAVEPGGASALSASEVLGAADGALFAAKRAGRGTWRRASLGAGPTTEGERR